jgi:hypothetical protein
VRQASPFHITGYEIIWVKPGVSASPSATQSFDSESSLPTSSYHQRPCGFTVSSILLV